MLPPSFAAHAKTVVALVATPAFFPQGCDSRCNYHHPDLGLHLGKPALFTFNFIFLWDVWLLDPVSGPMIGKPQKAKGAKCCIWRCLVYASPPSAGAKTARSGEHLFLSLYGCLPLCSLGMLLVKHVNAWHSINILRLHRHRGPPSQAELCGACSEG